MPPIKDRASGIAVDIKLRTTLTQRIGRLAGDTAFEAKWFGKFLAQMKEPPLPEFTKEANAEVYRMMILPTWGNAILVRVQKHGAIYSLSARRLGGQAGSELGKLVEAKDFELSADDSKALEQLIQNLSFFQLATDDGVLGPDGDEWILEGVSQGVSFARLLSTPFCRQLRR